MVFNRMTRRKDIAKRMIIMWIIAFALGVTVGILIGGLIW